MLLTFIQTDSKNNDLGDSSTDKQPEWGGLSPFGSEAIEEINRLGIMVDISHLDDETFWGIIQLTEASVIASHYSAHASRCSPLMKLFWLRGNINRHCYTYSTAK